MAPGVVRLWPAGKKNTKDCEYMVPASPERRDPKFVKRIPKLLENFFVGLKGFWRKIEGVLKDGEGSRWILTRTATDWNRTHTGRPSNRRKPFFLEVCSRWKTGNWKGKWKTIITGSRGGLIWTVWRWSCIPQNFFFWYYYLYYNL